MKKSFIILAIALFILIAVISGIYLDLLIYADHPADPGAAAKMVTVKPGEGFKLISKQLHAINIVNNPFKFSLLARIKGHDKSIKAGEYLLSATLPPAKILDILVSGKVFLYRLTIPEGYDLRQIAATVAVAGLAEKEAFLKAAQDAVLVKTRGIDADTFEGYLFPETYHFPRGITPEKIIATMVRRFWSVFLPQWKQQAQKLGFSIHQVLTLASIIEKETGAAAERPLISSVFHNRLKKRMRLESDPTAIYGLESFDGNITRKHLNSRTPYNTYIIRGLPPGPIANPGIKAIEAALYPASTPYLYFVAKKDRTHYFSTNISEHNRAVRKYQINR